MCLGSCTELASATLLPWLILFPWQVMKCDGRSIDEATCWESHGQLLNAFVYGRINFNSTKWSPREGDHVPPVQVTDALQSNRDSPDGRLVLLLERPQWSSNLGLVDMNQLESTVNLAFTCNWSRKFLYMCKLFVWDVCMTFVGVSCPNEFVRHFVRYVSEIYL